LLLEVLGDPLLTSVLGLADPVTLMTTGVPGLKGETLLVTKVGGESGEVTVLRVNTAIA
jgi:hypothetical protein